jgi:hypothetical protein
MRSVPLLVASVFVLGVAVVVAGLCGYSHVSPQDCQAVVGGTAGWCYKTLNCTTACARVGQTSTCKECKNGVNYTGCAPGAPSDGCVDNIDNDNPKYCGTVYTGTWSATAQPPNYGACITYEQNGAAWRYGCLTQTADGCLQRPNSVSGNPCGL